MASPPVDAAEESIPRAGAPEKPESSSRPLRIPRRLRRPLKLAVMLRLLFLAALCCGSLFHLDAQTDGGEPLGVLVSGPAESRGIPFLPTNTIEHYLGRYETAEGEVLVYYTEKEIVPLGSWETGSCGALSLRRFLVDESGTVEPVAFFGAEEYRLFFRFGSGAVDCGFIETFLNRFRYFRSLPEDGGGTETPPFPAVVGL